MSEEVKNETKPTEVQKVETPSKAETIDVDVDGVSIPNVPIAIAKQIIEKRQATKKELGSLKEAVARAEAESKSAQERAKLLEAMKAQDVESVKSQIATEYVEKIAKYENKIFKGELKSLMASKGVLPTAIDDAVALAMQGAKVSLEGDEIKINDKLAKDAIEEFIKARPHLVAVKAETKPTITGKRPQVSTSGDFKKFASGLFNK
jgi:hypothetical protein